MYRRSWNFVVKIFSSMTFSDKNWMQNIFYNICWPIPTLVAEVWRQNLDYLQAKYFTCENIPIYGICTMQVVRASCCSARNRAWDSLAIDYRATYVYEIKNWRMPLIEFHWAALKYYSWNMALATINRKSPFAAICQALGWNVELLTAKTRLGSVLEMSLVLSEALFAKSKPGPHGGILFVQVVTLR